MVLSSIFDFIDDFQEFCFIVSNLLGLQSVLKYPQKECLPAISLKSTPNILCDFRNEESCANSKVDELNALHSNVTPCVMHFQRLQKTLFRYVRNSAQLSEPQMKRLSLKCRHGPKTSTPQYGCQTVQVCTSSEQYHELKNKVIQLEGEVTALKKQMASILNIHPGSSGKFTPPLLSTQGPPPPPPPPPPSITTNRLPLPLQLNNKSKVPTQKIKGRTERGKENHLDMITVLKGMKDVKLRPTEKSPGGTPIRIPRHIIDPDDPTNLLTHALKKRFASIYPQDSADSSSDSSWLKETP